MNFIKEITHIKFLKMKWFALEIDRCFKTGLYGNGIEIYIEKKRIILLNLNMEK